MTLRWPRPTWRHEIDNLAGQIFLAVFHDQLAIGINRREVIKKNDVAGVFRGSKPISFTLSKANNAPSLGGRICPETTSPLRR